MANVTVDKKNKTCTFFCDFCKKYTKKSITTYYKSKKQSNFFCSYKCHHNFMDKRITVKCGYCNKPVIKTQYDIKISKSGKSFCNRSCAGSYNIKLRKKSRRSKIEIKFFEQLQQKFNFYF